MARCAVLLIRFGIPSANCAPRRRGWRVAPVSWKYGSERLCHWRVAQLHMARRVPSMFITRVAQNSWRGAPARNLYKKIPFSDLGDFLEDFL
ncbi:hypothetical protein A2U01_0052725 [Trifolium medium]|uniref:Secreted protein n=1 Tax=Trifolium medium TaxID=97028 RepID=A0A392R4K8_9FABA|nr:hypothetical protein [Trifolium medium]